MLQKFKEQQFFLIFQLEKSLFHSKVESQYKLSWNAVKISIRIQLYTALIARSFEELIALIGFLTPLLRLLL